MSILLIDDLRDFQPGVIPASEEIVIARTSEAALNILTTNKGKVWENIWFDHDLGGDDRTMRVMDYMNEEAFNGSPVNVARVIVHTSNTAGGDSLVQGFRCYGYNVIRVNAADYLVS